MSPDLPPYHVLAEAMLVRCRRSGRHRKLVSSYEAAAALHAHIESLWVAIKASDEPMVRDALVRIGAEAKRAAEDLDLELQGRFGEMVAIASRRPARREAGPITASLDLYGRLMLAEQLFMAAVINEELDHTRDPEDREDPVDLDRLNSPEVIRPIDVLIHFHLLGRKGCEDLGLTPKAA